MKKGLIIGLYVVAQFLLVNAVLAQTPVKVDGGITKNTCKVRDAKKKGPVAQFRLDKKDKVEYTKMKKPVKKVKVHKDIKMK